MVHNWTSKPADISLDVRCCTQSRRKWYTTGPADLQIFRMIFVFTVCLKLYSPVNTCVCVCTSWKKCFNNVDYSDIKYITTVKLNSEMHFVDL